MKRLFPLLLCCLVLWGCQSNPAQPVTPPEPTQSAVLPAPEYVPGHPLAQSAPEALKVYPLDWDVQAVLSLGEKLLLLSGTDTTELILMDRDSLEVLAAYSLPFGLASEGLHMDTGTLSCFDPSRRETLVLSTRLTEIRRIAAPEGLVGTPIYSGEDNTLYYCTAGAIRAWNLDSGIRRCVREQSYESQVLVDVHQSGILQCRIQDEGQTRTQFLSAEAGNLLAECGADANLWLKGRDYFARIPEGSIRLALFGQTDKPPRQLTPRRYFRRLLFPAGGKPGNQCHKGLDPGLLRPGNRTPDEHSEAYRSVPGTVCGISGKNGPVASAAGHRRGRGFVSLGFDGGGYAGGKCPGLHRPPIHPGISGHRRSCPVSAAGSAAGRTPGSRDSDR